MGFSSFNDDAGLAAVKTAPPVESYPNAHRWFKHIQSYVVDFPLLPGNPGKVFTAYGPADSPAVRTSDEQPGEKVISANSDDDDDDDDDDDLFGSDSEEEDPETVAERGRRLEEYRQKKAGKSKPAAKSIITLDIKPHGDEVDMNELKDGVLQIAMDGLVWGRYKLVPVGYGIRKLQINLVVEDEKVSLDELEEKITEGLPDHVQSMDVAAMQKL